MIKHGLLGPIEWGFSDRPRVGEDVCGDRALAIDSGDDTVLLAVLDGLGHGPEACAASTLGVQTIRNARVWSLEEIFHMTDRALAGTRGAVITLARIDSRAGALRWAGVGNVRADLVAKHPGGPQVRASARLTAGVVGFRLPNSLFPQEMPIRPGDLLVFVTDGIVDGYLRDIDFSASTSSIAEAILRDYARDDDDALALVARRGFTPPVG